ncbi:MAG: alpha/beta hydrolase [Myxococcaceae bacterium]|nr:alpha/beta hydrolase [Myxococcaceae bacterium]
MVATGQYLERPTLIPVGREVMEGLSHRGARRPLLLVLSPLPEEGGGMDHVVGAELSWAAARAGFPSLRFNWRGVGGSQGRRGRLPSLIEDARAALEVARDNAGGAKPLIASIGGSFEVATALEGDAAGVCLVSPTDIDEWGADVWVVVAQADLSAKLKVATGRLHVIPGADRTFQKNLPLVGKAVVECLNALETLE